MVVLVTDQWMSDAAEAAQVSKMVTQLALCYPEVGFTLTSAGRKLLQCPPVTKLEDRLYQIYGDRPDLIAVARDAGVMKVRGFDSSGDFAAASAFAAEAHKIS